MPWINQGWADTIRNLHPTKQSALPVMQRAANGMITARVAEIEEQRVGPIRASALPVLVSTALGNIDILGTSLLSKLQAGEWKGGL